MSEINEKSRVNVSLRIRPPVNGEEGADSIIVTSVGDRTVAVQHNGRSQLLFKYDHVFTDDQSTVFDCLGRPMLEEAYKGFNVCLFAYGQTGSGKTYSLLGNTDNEDERGIAPRFVKDLFDEAQCLVEGDPDLTIKVSLSMIEVYMEKVRDLLAPRQRGQEPESLEIHEDSNHRVSVKGVGIHQVLSYERMMELLRKGNANRQTAETKMNETSSRSHAIIQMTVSQEYQALDKKDLECTISLVDLAGSERQTKTESTGQQFEEAKKINHSLLMLGRALNSFSDRKSNDAFISLRESKLTRLLSESFGGNSKTWMLATVSPTLYNLTETISTLQYATNAMAITNKVKINKIRKDREYEDLVKMRAVLDTALTKETALVEEYDFKSSDLRSEIEMLKRELARMNDSKIESELQNALKEREDLVKGLYDSLKNIATSPESVLVCCSGTCKMSLANIPIGSYEIATLVVPLYDLVGPPPLLESHVHVAETESNDIVVVVEVKEIHHFPDFCSGGVRISVWFEGQSSSKVTTDIFDTNDGNPQISFCQSYVFGPISDELQRFFSADVLYFQVDGIIATPEDNNTVY